MEVKCPNCDTVNPSDSKFCKECAASLVSAEDISVLPTKTLKIPIQELSRGRTFAGRYEIIEELGKGGMGQVYRVFDKKIEEEVTLKLIKPEIASDKRTIERFRNELKLARKITHKNICRMYDLNEEEGIPYITMEYIPGENLKSMIAMTDKLSAGTAVKIAKQICEGLAEAHRLGVVHRDLKPSNIMIDKEGNVRILDFGIARSHKTKRTTIVGAIIGTPEYMSPEQAETKAADHRSDIYSLGVVLFEMVTGRIPFKGETPLGIAMKHKGEKPPNPRKLNPQIPESLSQVILKCLKKKKEERYQRAEDLLSELIKVEEGIPTTERGVPKKMPSTLKKITATLGKKKNFVPILALIVILALTVIIWRIIPIKKEVLPPKIENSLAIISFENQTGDRAYDYLQKAVPNLLITNLENTGFFYVATWERMHDLLEQMGKDDVELIDRDLGFEVCRREGIEAIVLGSFVKAGDMFATDVKVLDVGSKKIIKSATSKGEGVRSILERQIDELSKEIFQGIGIAKQESEASQMKIAEVTTASMAAYENFLEGRDCFHKFYMEDARDFLEKAIKIDPDFAVAYLYLARTYQWLNDPKAQDEAYERAWDLSDRASEKERLYIQAAYVLDVEGDAEKSFLIHQEIARKYPREKSVHYHMATHYRGQNVWDEAIKEYKIALELDPKYGTAMNDLAYTYLIIGDYENAIEYFKKYAFAYPEDANPHDSLAEAYLRKGNLDEAIASYKKALEIKPDFGSDSSIGYIYALKEDFQEALGWYDQFIERAASPGRKVWGHMDKSLVQSFRGEIKNSLESLESAFELAESIGNRFQMGLINFRRTWIYYESGELDLCRKYLDSWFGSVGRLDISYLARNTAMYNFLLGLVDLKEDKLDSAQSRLKEMGSVLKDVDSAIKVVITSHYYLLQGEVFLAEGLTEEAILAYQKLPEIEMPNFQNPVIAVYNLPPQRDVLARAYQNKEDWDKASAEYEQLITFKADSRNRFFIHPLYHYRLAKLYEKMDDSGKALRQYEKFLSLWRDADPALLEVEDARKRLAQLK
jgi:serine/threonine protein kinase/Tfp pilus assembly protein PilF